MADYTVADALGALKTILLTASAAGQPALAAGYVMPDEFAAIPDTLLLPSIVVSELYNSPADWQRKADGLAIHTWRAEALLFAAQGPLTTLNADAAVAMLKARNWAKAFSDRLWLNQSLNGSALIIGEPTGGMRRLFRYGIGHVYLTDAGEFWGLRLELVIQQKHTQPMSAQES